MHNAMFGNAETLRTQSVRMRISSALSASPRFKSSRAEIAEHGYVLTPGRYVGAEDVEDDGTKGHTQDTQSSEYRKLRRRQNLRPFGNPGTDGNPRRLGVPVSPPCFA